MVSWSQRDICVSDTVGVKRCALACESRKLSKSLDPSKLGIVTPKPTPTWKSWEGANVQMSAFAT